MNSRANVASPQAGSAGEPVTPKRSDGPGPEAVRKLERAIQAETLPCELRTQRNSDRVLYLRDGRILQSSSTATSGCSARFVTGRVRGFAASAASDEAAIQTVLRHARDQLDCLQQHWPYPTGPARPDVASVGIYDFGTTRRRYTAQDRIERLRDLNARAKHRFPSSRTIICGLEEVAVERTLVTSEGTRFYGYSPRTTLVLQLEVERDGKRGQASDNFTLFGDLEDRMDDLIRQVSAALDELHEHARADLEAIYPQTGSHDVVMTSGLTGLLAHEAIGHPCEADHVIMGSAVADALGQQVSSEKITLVDQAGCGFDGRATTAAYVDDEGVACRDVVLIENGRLVGFLHNRLTARLMGGAPMGNARAGTFADEPLIRMRNTAILPGHDKLSDMIGATDHGYMLERPGRGQADLSGKFTFGVTRGYEIRHGRVGRAIRNMTVSGNAFDVLKSASHVGSDFDWMPSGWCAKGQSIPVSMGGPSIKSRLMIGGK
jgi:TldD protein